MANGTRYPNDDEDYYVPVARRGRLKPAPTPSPDPDVEVRELQVERDHLGWPSAFAIATLFVVVGFVICYTLWLTLGH